MPRAARSRKNSVPPQPQSSSEPQPGDIARRAYELFEARGHWDGGDLEDWFQAERELLRQAASQES
jgi:hypothetical protein